MWIVVAVTFAAVAAWCFATVWFATVVGRSVTPDDEHEREVIRAAVARARAEEGTCR